MLPPMEERLLAPVTRATFPVREGREEMVQSNGRREAGSWDEDTVIFVDGWGGRL